jgi:hypothetical protein
MISVPLNKSTKTITTKKINNMEFLNNAEEVSVQHNKDTSMFGS